MRSSNPVFSRTDGFNGAAPVGFDQHPTHTELGRGTGRMTLDTVIEKTAITAGTVVVTAGIAWVLIGNSVIRPGSGTGRGLEGDAVLVGRRASADSSWRWSTRSRRSSAPDSSWPTRPWKACSSVRSRSSSRRTSRPAIRA